MKSIEFKNVSFSYPGAEEPVLKITGKYEDLIHKLSPTVKNLSRSNQTSGATPTNQASGSITFSVKKSGYKPVAIMGYDTSNATDSAGISRVGTSGIWLNYSNQTCTWSWMAYGKTSQSKRQYKVKVVVLYIKANDNDEPA